MKKIALLAAAVSMGTHAVAAEESFVGGYIGANAGLFQGEATTTEYDGDWDYGEYSMTGGLDATFGVQTGYNWKIGSASIVGVELDISAPSFKESRYFDSGAYINEAEANTIVSLRAKTGLVMDKALLYVSAGIAQADVDFTFGDKAVASNRTEDSVSGMGLTFGAGAEFALQDSLTLKAEYAISDFESEEIKDMGGDTGDFHFAGSSFTVGVNYYLY